MNGLYQVSNLGNVRSLNYNKAKKIQHLKKVVINKRGYLAVGLSKNGIFKIKTVHRLVAETFISNPNNLPQVNHIDGNKMNNSITNLEWCTKNENQNHAVRTGLMQRGQNRPSAKLTEKQVLEIYKLKGVLKGQDIANKYGVSKNTINCILRGSKWSYLYKQYFKNETI